jgi:hypothetical protein
MFNYYNKLAVQLCMGCFVRECDRTSWKHLAVVYVSFPRVATRQVGFDWQLPCNLRVFFTLSNKICEKCFDKSFTRRKLSK